MDNRKQISILIALLGIVFLAFSLMYPTTPGQRLWDSTNYHYMTRLVSRDGTAHWNLGILSLYEFYPISAGNMGQVYFLSGLSQLTGLKIQPSIYLMNLGWMVLLCLSSFLLGRRIFKDNISGLLTAFFLMSTRIVLSNIAWTATSRGFASAILPFIFLLMISSYGYNHQKFFRGKIFALFILILLISPTIHRLYYLFVPVIISYFIYVKFYPFIKSKTSSFLVKVRLSHERITNLSGLVLYPTIIGVAVLLSLIFGTMFFGAVDFLTESAILQGEHILIQMTNYFYAISRSMGVAAVFSYLGILYLSKDRKNFFEFFLFVGVVAFIPLSIRGAYSQPGWVLFLSLFAAFGFKELSTYITSGTFRANIKTVFVVILLISPIFLPPLVVITEPYKPERTRPTHVTDIEMETGHYLKHNLEDHQTFFADPIFNSHILTGLSGREGLGLQGVEFATANDSLRENMKVEPLINLDEFDSIVEFLEEVHRRKAVFYRLSYDPLFPESSYYRRRHFLYLRRRFLLDDYNQIIEAYNIETIIIDDPFVGEHSYINTLEDREYVTYSNSRYTFYPAPKPIN